MQITVVVTRRELEEPELLSLEVYPEMTIGALQSSIEAENSVPPNAQHLYHNGERITDADQTLQQLNVTDGDMIAMRIHTPRTAGGGPAAPVADVPQGEATIGSGVPGADVAAVDAAVEASNAHHNRQRRTQPDPEMIRLQILGDPQLRAEAIRQQPQLANVIDDRGLFAEFFRQNYERERRETLERQRQIAQLNADPFDIEAQARIEEIIRQERVMENLQNAMEHNPEVFGRVHMLYIDVEVNGHKVKALVDSGAQATIMSPSCAEECNIMRLVDKRFAGVARGVGTATIIGRVHSAQIKIGTLFLPCSFTVMEGKAVDLLIGLDMLKRYQATIDLAKDRLVIQDVEVPFLGEAEIPKEAEEALSEPTIPGPSGTTIGQHSGAVSAPGGGQDAGAQQQSAPPQPQAEVGTGSNEQTAADPQPQQPPAAAGPASAPAQPQQEAVSEAAVEQLMALGFPREAAVQSLQVTGGNVEYAASLLFQG